MQANINLKQFHALIFIRKITAYLLVLKYLNRIIKIIQPDGTFKNNDSENMFGSLAYLNSDNTRMLRFRGGMIHTFDSSGRLTSIEDTNNNKVTITRQSGGLITSIKEPAGKALNFTYDANSRITSIQDPIGRIVTYTYNSQGTLWKVTDPAGGVTTYTYDTQNRLQSITDARGIKFLQNIYDAYGRVSKQIMPDGGEFNLYYFSASTPVRIEQYIVPSVYCGGRTMTVFAREGELSSTSGACSTVYVNVPSSRAVPEEEIQGTPYLFLDFGFCKTYH